jgi:hypothetical protein
MATRRRGKGEVRVEMPGGEGGREETRGRRRGGEEYGPGPGAMDQQVPVPWVEKMKEY